MYDIEKIVFYFMLPDYCHLWLAFMLLLTTLWTSTETVWSHIKYFVVYNRCVRTEKLHRLYVFAKNKIINQGFGADS